MTLNTYKTKYRTTHGTVRTRWIDNPRKAGKYIIGFVGCEKQIKIPQVMIEKMEWISSRTI